MVLETVCDGWRFSWIVVGLFRVAPRCFQESIKQPSTPIPSLQRLFRNISPEISPAGCFSVTIGHPLEVPGGSFDFICSIVVGILANHSLKVSVCTNSMVASFLLKLVAHANTASAVRCALAVRGFLLLRPPRTPRNVMWIGWTAMDRRFRTGESPEDVFHFSQLRKTRRAPEDSLIFFRLNPEPPLLDSGLFSLQHQVSTNSFKGL